LIHELEIQNQWKISQENNLSRKSTARRSVFALNQKSALAIMNELSKKIMY